MPSTQKELLYKLKICASCAGCAEQCLVVFIHVTSLTSNTINKLTNDHSKHLIFYVRFDIFSFL